MGDKRLTGPPCPQLSGLCPCLHCSTVLRPRPVLGGPSRRPPLDWVSSSELWVQMWSQIPLCLECAPLSSVGTETEKGWSFRLTVEFYRDTVHVSAALVVFF